MAMNREFTTMVAVGATMQTGPNANSGSGYDNSAVDKLTSIGEDELKETKSLAIVPDSHPIATPATSKASGLEVVPAGPPPPPPAHVEASQVKKEKVETKVTAWQTLEVAKINNRFEREEVVINRWETEQVGDWGRIGLAHICGATEVFFASAYFYGKDGEAIGGKFFLFFPK
ncbi:remorin 4.1-like [Setaria viridis]|uniref:remorin 4.1-like n=1 Tax=Setaria viridis TaxID=4556 RepID=UPI0014933CFC|nr:remorin 4.1-like [Setaria viridis]